MDIDSVGIIIDIVYSTNSHIEQLDKLHFTVLVKPNESVVDSLKWCLEYLDDNGYKYLQHKLKTVICIKDNTEVRY